MTITTSQRHLFEAAAELEHMALINRVVELATAIRDGDGRQADHLVDHLVVHARVLAYRHRTRRTGYPMHLATTPRLDEMQPRGLAAQTRDNPRVMTMNMVTSDRSGTPGFVSTTAAFVRTTFGGGPTPIDEWLRSMSLATLPGELPSRKEAPVVLYGTLQGGVSAVLLAIRDGVDPAEAITHVINRVVHHHPFPWEPGGWNGD